MNYTRNMHQTATYWPPGAPDPFGMPTFLEPVVVKCRWQDKAELFRDPEGRETTSSAVVYPAQPLEAGGYLLLGESTELNPKEVPGAREIRQKGSSPSLRNSRVLHKVWL